MRERDSSIAGLGAELEALRRRPAPKPEIIEKIVEKPVELIVEKIVEVEKIVYREREPAPAAATPRKRAARKPDDLKLIYGVGPVLEAFLNEHGVLWFRQVAKWKKKDIEKFEAMLPDFAGRIERENWVRSAIEEHYKRYGKWLGEGEPRITMPETNR